MEDKKKKYDLIRWEFYKMQGRFDENPGAMLFAAFFACGIFLFFGYEAIKDYHDAGKLEHIIVGIQFVSYFLGCLTAVIYYILARLKKSRRVFPFAVLINLVNFCFYLCVFSVVRWRDLFRTGAEHYIILIIMIGVVVFFIEDSIRFHYLANRGNYNEEAESYQFSFGKKEIAAGIILFLAFVPISGRRYIHGSDTSILPDDMRNLYIIYLFCLMACMVHRIIVKAWINLVVIRSWLEPEEKVKEKRNRRGKLKRKGKRKHAKDRYIN